MKPTLLAMRLGPYVPLLLIAAAVSAAPFVDSAAERLPEIAVSDNRAPRGRLHNGVLGLELEAREGIWYPEERDGPGLRVQAFAERGRPQKSLGRSSECPKARTLWSTYTTRFRVQLSSSTDYTPGRAIPMTSSSLLLVNDAKFAFGRAHPALIT